MANRVFSAIMAVAVFMFLTLSQTPETSGQNRDPRICISYFDLEAVVNENTFLYARDNSYPIEDIFRDGFPENFRILKCTSEKEARKQNYPNFFYRINLTDLCIPDYIKPSNGHELLGSFSDSQLRICFAEMFSVKYAFLMDRRAGIFKQTFPFQIPGFNRIMQLHLIDSTLYYRECTEDHYFFCVRRPFSNVSLSETDARMIRDMQYNQESMEEQQEKINTKTLNDYCQECEMKCKKEPEEVEQVAKDTEMQNNDRLISELMNNKEVEEKQVAKGREMKNNDRLITELMNNKEVEEKQVAKGREMKNNDRLISELMNNNEVEEKQVAKGREMKNNDRLITELMNNKEVEEKQVAKGREMKNNDRLISELKNNKEVEEKQVAKDTEMQNNDRLISELMNNKEVEEKQVAKDTEMQKHPDPIDFLMSAREEHY